MIKAIVATAAITATLTAIITVGIMDTTRPTPVTAQTPTTYAPPAQPNARYQIFFSPLARADTYMVDTQSGSIWQVQADDKGNEMLNQLAVVPQPSK